MTTHRKKLEALTSQVLEGKIGSGDLWQGADVQVTSKQPSQVNNGFYPSARYVVTAHPSELSWLFNSIGDIFSSLDGYAIWKEELFGRLGNAAIRSNDSNPDIETVNLLLRVLHEAFLVSDEIDSNKIKSLPITYSKHIYDDFIDEIKKEGFLSIEETKRFLEGQGSK